MRNHDYVKQYFEQDDNADSIAFSIVKKRTTCFYHKLHQLEDSLGWLGNIIIRKNVIWATRFFKW